MIATPDVLKFLAKKGFIWFEEVCLVDKDPQTTPVVRVSEKGEKAIFSAMCEKQVDTSVLYGDGGTTAVASRDTINALFASLAELPVYLASPELAVRRAARVRARCLGAECE